MSDLINLPKGVPMLNAEQIKEAFEYALDKLHAEGWQVLIDPGSSRTRISVNQAKKEIYIPQGRTDTPQKIAALITHEIGTHVARRTNGERSRLMLLGIGLDRAEVGEEGVATTREQAFNDEIADFAGLQSHLAIGLALGVDGQPRDFREVYEVLHDYFHFKKLADGEAMDQAKKKAEDLAWKNAVATFRGTTCEAGTAFTKDIIYRQGNIAVWDVIKRDSDEALRFSIGRYDPANERHIWILEQLGISEADLSTLEE